MKCVNIGGLWKGNVCECKITNNWLTNVIVLRPKIIQLNICSCNTPGNNRLWFWQFWQFQVIKAMRYIWIFIWRSWTEQCPVYSIKEHQQRDKTAFTYTQSQGVCITRLQLFPFNNKGPLFCRTWKKFVWRVRRSLV